MEYRTIQLQLSEPELRVLIREEQTAALEEYEKRRSKNDRFSDLPKNLMKKDVAELFGVSVNTVSNWTKEGILTAIKFKRAVRYDRDTIIKLILEGGVRKFHTNKG